MKLIAILSQKGGGGKSTLARVLAVELTKKHKVLLIDLDWQQKTSLEWSERRKKLNIKPLIECQVYPYFPTELLKQKYDYLIIDGPAKISKESLLIARQANLVIQPVRPSLDDLNPAIREFNGLFKAGVVKKKLGFIINCTSSQTEEKNAREYLTEAGYFVFATSLSDRVSYREAQNYGLAISEVKYQRLKEQSKQLIREIITRI